MAYQPIEDYGIIGNMRTPALVGMDGSIDWFCFPRFGSPSVFAAILDEKKGGKFKIAHTSGEVTHKQHYWPETNVLITRFLSPDGVGEVADFMPVGDPAQNHRQNQLIRVVTTVRGTMKFRCECTPAFDYARSQHSTEIGPGGARFHSEALSLGLEASIPLKRDGNGVIAEFTLHEGQTAVFALREIHPGEGLSATLSEPEAAELFKSTVGYWRRWLSQ